jgi:hypothetical protein
MTTLQHNSMISADEQPNDASATDLQEEVRRRAFQLYEERGDAPGDSLGDWLQAEREILGSANDQEMKAAA